jgi:hypothetical protein
VAALQLEALGVYATISTFIAACSDHDLLAATRCRGWTVADLLFHMTCDAQRALVTFATPATDAPDVDVATYWEPFHLLGLTVQFPDAAPPPPAALRTVRRTLDTLLGSPIGAPSDDTTYALKATGRSPLDHHDRAQLGEQAQRLPLLG